jgi:hypothetical protein
MLKFFIAFALLTSLTVQASITNIVQEVEVEEHIEHMRKKGFSLSNVKDNFATDVRRPRCICDNYTFSYSKFFRRNNEATVQEKKFDVNSNGFGAAKKIRIHELR